jgi:hypothetical protein
LGVQPKSGISEQSAISLIFKIEIDGLVAPFLSYRPRQSGLANLARTEQNHTGHMLQPVFDGMVDATRDHGCTVARAFI